ncbi:MAG: hypothetical protein KDJ35_08385 [Alphaproteobacteria bacterium]|nr:hypothetical protein [Alphaproteobacteria bacterium]
MENEINDVAKRLEKLEQDKNRMLHLKKQQKRKQQESNKEEKEKRKAQENKANENIYDLFLLKNSLDYVLSPYKSYYLLWYLNPKNKGVFPANYRTGILAAGYNKEPHIQITFNRSGTTTFTINKNIKSGDFEIHCHYYKHEISRYETHWNTFQIKEVKKKNEVLEWYQGKLAEHFFKHGKPIKSIFKPPQSQAKLSATFNKNIDKETAWNSITAMFKGASTSLIPGGYGGPLNPAKNDNEIRAGDIFQNSQRKLTIQTWAPKESFSYKEGTNSKGVVEAVMNFSINEIGKDLILVVERTENKTGVGGMISRSNAYKTLKSVTGSATAYAGGWKDLPINNIELSKG